MSGRSGHALVGIDIVEDRTAGSGPDEGFLRVKRFLVRNHYNDATYSEAYPCDVVSRAQPDAVGVVLYALGEDGIVRVVLRSGVRPAVYLRRHKSFVQPDEDDHLLLLEIAAGLLEPDDTGPQGVDRRAKAEAVEETGYTVDLGAVAKLGATAFPTPGVSDEKVFFRAAPVDLAHREEPGGDGSVMEEAGDTVILPLRDALRRCRTGAIRDMKTEIALGRLCDHLGYIPQLDRFVDALPDEIRPRGDAGAWLLGEDVPEPERP